VEPPDSGTRVTSAQYLAAFFSGGGVGFVLGMLGGGGSILAVPALLYLVGIPGTHTAIGTSALGVGVNALWGLWGHARRGTVKWLAGIIFAVTGSAGAFAGAQLGRVADAKSLLLAFAGVMVVVALAMLRPAATGGDPNATVTRPAALKLALGGLMVGLASGFFGIGGGFLIVPGLMAAAGIPMLNAVGTSLISVATFGFTTAASYAFHDLVLWDIALAMIAGGALGSTLGVRAGRHLAAQRATLQKVFAALVIVVAVYVAYRALNG
jgi:uncharacterized membrane protein YfcA